MGCVSVSGCVVFGIGGSVKTGSWPVEREVSGRDEYCQISVIVFAGKTHILCFSSFQDI